MVRGVIISHIYKSSLELTFTLQYHGSPETKGLSRCKDGDNDDDDEDEEDEDEDED